MEYSDTPDELVQKIDNHMRDRHGKSDLQTDHVFKQNVEKHIRRFDSLLQVFSDNDEREKLRSWVQETFVTALQNQGIIFQAIVAPRLEKFLEPLGDVYSNGLAYQRIKDEMTRVAKKAAREIKARNVDRVDPKGIHVGFGRDIEKFLWTIVFSVQC